jgi:hypothetical protein
MHTQYVVDIKGGTHDIAPTLRQTDKIAAITKVYAGIGESCGNLSTDARISHTHVVAAALGRAFGFAVL